MIPDLRAMIPDLREINQTKYQTNLQNHQNPSNRMYQSNVSLTFKLYMVSHKTFLSIFGLEIISLCEGGETMLLMVLSDLEAVEFNYLSV